MVFADRARAVDELSLRRMARAMRHRGPDGYGIATDAGAGFVSTRLAIFDIPGGWQPMLSEDERSLMIYNGEVYNHYELRAEATKDGRPLAHAAPTPRSCTGCSTARAPPRSTASTASGRSRTGAATAASCCSCATASACARSSTPSSRTARSSSRARPRRIFASGLVRAEPDPDGIDEVFTFWAARPPRTVFKGVRLLRPGHLLTWREGRVEERVWWQPQLRRRRPRRRTSDELLRDSVRLRLRADVPVGTYLSGGLDSSLTTALAVEQTDHQLRTFSVAFRDPHFDESGFQREVAAELGSQHHVIDIGPEEIADCFQDVVWHLETPVVRTAPAPLYLLAAETRRQGITVVATGEGADELYWGYDLFKEAKVRAFCARDPAVAGAAGAVRPPLPVLRAGGRPARRGLAPLLPRGRRARRPALLAPDAHGRDGRRQGPLRARHGAASSNGSDPLARLRADLPEGFARWSTLERTAYLELTTLLETYLLASQADRVGMAHGVEGRFPFLDHRVFAHSVATPSVRKLCGLREKVALRDLAGRVLPLAHRRAHEAALPRARGRGVLRRAHRRVGGGALSPDAVRAAGIFDERAVEGLVRRCRAGKATGFRENMALVGVLSTQIWHARFCAGGPMAYPARDRRAARRLHAALRVRRTTRR